MHVVPIGYKVIKGKGGTVDGKYERFGGHAHGVLIVA